MTGEGVAAVVCCLEDDQLLALALRAYHSQWGKDERAVQGCGTGAAGRAPHDEGANQATVCEVL